MSFVLFVLVTAALFIRPWELMPGLESVPVYNILILSALAAGFGPVLEVVRGRTLRAQPVVLCAIGFGVMVWVSNLARLDFWTARFQGMEFLKVLVYFLLLVALLSTPARLLRFLTCLAVLTAAVTVIAVLDFHKVIDIPSLRPLDRADSYDPNTGELIVIQQLVATGTFNDPNDFCAILVVGIMIALSRLGDWGAGLGRLVWVLPAGLFFYAVLLTKSRGGMLALLCGLFVLFESRYGWKRAVPVLVLLGFGLFFAGGGRQFRLSTGEDTAQSRMELWSEALHMLRGSPLTGVGAGQFQEAAGFVAHNSFVHANAELGLLGGTCFLACFYLPLKTLHRMKPGRVRILDPTMLQLRPYLMAMLAGYACSLASITRCYVVPTFLIIGLPTVFMKVARVDPPSLIPRSSGRLAGELFIANLAAIAGIYLLVRMSVSYG